MELNQQLHAYISKFPQHDFRTFAPPWSPGRGKLWTRLEHINNSGAFKMKSFKNLSKIITKSNTSASILHLVNTKCEAI